MDELNTPPLVEQLTKHCDGWIVGEAAEPDNDSPQHFEVYIPPQHWGHASGYIKSKKISLNPLGGIQIKSTRDKRLITIWTGDMNEIFATDIFTFAHHPNSGVRIIRLNKEDM
jgi:hypothetical protein